MADANLASVRTRLRLIVNPPGRSPLTDDELDSFLTANREYVYREVLTTRDYKLYESNSDTFDLGAALSDADATALTPDTSNPLAGFWVFASEQYGRVFLTGYTYDLYGAGADAWEYLAGSLSDRFDATTDGATYRASQIATAYEKRRDFCRSRARARNVETQRDYR